MVHLAMVHRHGAVVHSRVIHLFCGKGKAATSALIDTASAMSDGRESLMVMVRICLGMVAAMLTGHFWWSMPSWSIEP